MPVLDPGALLPGKSDYRNDRQRAGIELVAKNYFKSKI